MTLREAPLEELYLFVHWLAARRDRGEITHEDAFEGFVAVKRELVARGYSENN